MTNKEAQLALANLKRYISGGGAVDKSVNKAIDMAIEALSKLELHWIPDTERLPETTGEYLVTKRGMYTHRLIVDIAMYFINDGWHKADPVIAWQPLPEPYKGVTE